MQSLQHDQNHYPRRRVGLLPLRDLARSLTHHSIAGLSAAAQLPKHHHITIVARDLPGDDHESHAWSSPHAGAIWMPLLDAPPREQDMQLQAFVHMWKIAGEFPESSVKVCSPDGTD